MPSDRVKFFEPNDFLYGNNLSKIETMPIPHYPDININDAIEFYEIKRYFDKGTRAYTWSDQDFQIYQDKTKTLYSFTMRFFNSINDTTVIQQYSTVESPYKKEFWALFDLCKLYEKISDSSFETLIYSSNIAPFDLFRHKNIVHRYGSILRNYILKSINHISILTHVYNQDYSNCEKLFLPDELSGTDICSYFELYIDSDTPHASILNTIVQMRYTSQFPINDELRLKAKRRCAKEIEKFSQTGVSIEYGIQLSFSPNQVLEKQATHNGDVFQISYSTQWLFDTLDFPSILNNFIYIFEYVDVPQMRFTHVSKPSEFGIFERAFASPSSRMYPCSVAFRFTNSLATMQMQAYYSFLKSNNIRLEDVLKWALTEYLQTEYDCPEIRVSFPSETSTYAEKCSSIITAMEAVLKQFSLYAKNGAIDFELVGMSTTPIKFENTLSLIKQKYLYGAGEDFNKISFLLFSDQCLCSFVHRIYEEGKTYQCFFDLISDESVFLSDYSEHDYPSFKYLEGFGLISIAPNGEITLHNTAKALLLKDLYKNQVISKWHYPDSVYPEMQDLIEEGILIENTGLLSVPETNYLNYLLNRSEYDNGLEIRNKYIHGIQQVNINETEHQQNYYTLLRIFVLLVIKINDDFDLREILKNLKSV